ncbi:hypothetical protein BC827DRAFT_734582 [Russula dissimulans]|nr:hypothetical protein BC827DRAFT_734582 [Russula dissimulans]
MSSPATPGLIFCTAATVLLVFVSVSEPTWHGVYFLRASTGASNIRFGVFGYTGTKVHIGYHFPITSIGLENCPPLLSTISRVPSYYIPSPPAYLASPCCSASAVPNTIVQVLFSWRFALR